ncbi:MULTISPECIES: polysaccharide pyruvyl transferase family protein [Cellulomonas]|uniref:polysaccharide pyruvyl transferase family protein n=1 Tax=Cellulomonas TaxID=1707 RepID=UPI0012FDB8A1|nr:MULTISPECIES: polysaccharide pyruvyl transferase family protein [Cellulomonas]UJP41130.1 polysaccharide pyruvyl transferase family protein [Cellulomonas palmilytica]
MRALVLWADDRSPNLGVRALAHGTAALLRRAFDDVTVEFQSSGRGVAPVPVGGPRQLVREHVTGHHGLRRWISGYDVVVDTRSGDSFADIYGLPRLTTMSLMAELATRSGVPVVLGPQTIGPFSTLAGRAVARRSLARATTVMARDHLSAQAAASLGREVDVLTTDVVFALPVPEVERDRDVVLNVSGLLWQPGPHVDATRYRTTVTTILDELTAQGRRVTLLAHVLASRGHDDDVPVVRELAAERGLEAVVPEDLDEVRRVVASATVVLGSRMHACLNALSVGTPAVPLAYSRKFAPLLEALGWHATVDLREDPDPAATALALVADPTLAAQAARVRETALTALLPAEAALRKLA